MANSIGGFLQQLSTFLILWVGARLVMANELYEYIIEECKKVIPVVERGSFGADMKVSLLNDGPFTIVLDSEQIC